MTPEQLLAEIADTLTVLQTEIPDLQVFPLWNENPTPPSFDVYPASPFLFGAAMGRQKQAFVTVRARVAVNDSVSAQQQLLALLDPTGPASVEAALEGVASVSEAGVNGFTQYADEGGDQKMLGCDWTMTAFLP